MTFNDILRDAAQLLRDHPSYRTGQAYFNALMAADPEFAVRITGTEADPFSNDDRILAFFRAVSEHFEAQSLDSDRRI